MSPTSIQPLESYKLAQYSVPVHCPLCDEPNLHDAGRCRRCSAPMAIATAATSRSQRPQLVVALGSPNCGKSVYLGAAIEMFTRGREELKFTAREANSITLQQRTMSALARCEFPERTCEDPSEWDWAHLEVRGKAFRREIELFIPDMAGDAIVAEVNRPGTHKLIQGAMDLATGVLLVVDSTRIAEGDRDEEFFCMKMLSHLKVVQQRSTMSRRRKLRNGKMAIPLAVLFTKTDYCEPCFMDPVEYARRHTGALWEECTERFANHRFFATSIAGACAGRPVKGGGLQMVPLRVEPRGVLEPIRWLIESAAKA
ncbi:MAG: hypothetical protein R3E01_16615 [Pirellulaceae bacterium]|nr:hypothetical protein [Planctomycetales bacterium]MCA9265970.1 hypothetical protein [Planctomycetales bacterium]